MNRRVTFFVDGFNLYHSIDGNPRLRKYKWLDLNALCRANLRKSEETVSILYFTSLAVWDQSKVTRHETYIKALTATGVETVYGRFKKTDKVASIPNPTGLGYQRIPYKSWEEKETDVNIAIGILEGAFLDQFDTAVLVTGDGDIVPAIRAVRRLCPTKQIRMLFPVGRASEELKLIAHSYSKIKESHLQTCQLPREVTLSDGYVVCRPDEWV